MHASRLITGLYRAAGLAGAAFGIALLGATTAHADAAVQLRSRLPGNWCLDAPGGAGAAAVVNPCDGSAAQRWVLNTNGQIESAASPGTCLSVANAADDTPVVLAHCAQTDNQHWTHQPDGKMTSPLGPCLNVFGGVARPGTPVIGYHGIPGVEDEEWDAVA